MNPTPFLAELTGSAVVVRLKWGMEYKGVLRSTDKHMNLQVKTSLPTFPSVSRRSNALFLCPTQLLNAEEFGSLLEAQVLAREWRQDYNHVRPSSPLGYRTPAE